MTRSSPVASERPAAARRVRRATGLTAAVATVASTVFGIVFAQSAAAQATAQAAAQAPAEALDPAQAPPMFTVGPVPAPQAGSRHHTRRSSAPLQPPTRHLGWASGPADAGSGGS